MQCLRKKKVISRVNKLFRSVIEEELEILYDAYYEELEHFANDQKKTSIMGKTKTIHQHIHPEELKASGILNVADDFLKNGGQKFLCLMEELASQKLRFIEDDGDKEGIEESDEEEWDDVYEDEEDDGDIYDEEDDEDEVRII